MVIAPMGPAAAADPSNDKQVIGYQRLTRPSKCVAANVESTKSPLDPELINALAPTARLPTHSVRVMTKQEPLAPDNKNLMAKTEGWLGISSSSQVQNPASSKS